MLLIAVSPVQTFNEYLLSAWMDWFYISSSHEVMPSSCCLLIQPKRRVEGIVLKTKWAIMLTSQSHWSRSVKLMSISRLFQGTQRRMNVLPLSALLMWFLIYRTFPSNCLQPMVYQKCHIWLLALPRSIGGPNVGWPWKYFKHITKKREQTGDVYSHKMTSQALTRNRSTGTEQLLLKHELHLSPGCSVTLHKSSALSSALSSPKWE